MVSSDRLITHQSTNSLAVVLFEIRKMERIHWFLGLRQAELAIESRSGALANQERLTRTGARQKWMNRWKIKRLNVLRWLGLGIILPLRGWIEALEDEIAAIDHATEHASPYIRDCLMERKAAEKERDRIAAEHAQELELGFDELQEQFSHDAMIQGHIKFLASRVWATQRNLPESVGDLLFSLNPQECEQVMNGEMRLRLKVDTHDALTFAGSVLAHLPQEEQRQVLLMAAQALVEQQANGSVPTTLSSY